MDGISSIIPMVSCKNFIPLMPAIRIKTCPKVYPCASSTKQFVGFKHIIRLAKSRITRQCFLSAHSPEPLTKSLIPSPAKVRLSPIVSFCKASLVGGLGESGWMMLHSQRIGALRADMFQDAV